MHSRIPAVNGADKSSEVASEEVLTNIMLQLTTHLEDLIIGVDPVPPNCLKGTGEELSLSKGYLLSHNTCRLPHRDDHSHVPGHTSNTGKRSTALVETATS
ncbi:hypothetical protein RRG08_036076 [Elysia crispata]|uniref:Uncharacterized protein n=1 Tax=Elysia crispata TaxID=231223 RepID=A0AAE1ALE1_9GAST|nr:hypothetical protein RRG08_036076 [Elysia crispata]